MIIDQGELLTGLTMRFVQQFVHAAVREDRLPGTVLIHEGEPATYFYTLVEGRVRLSIEEARQKVYQVSHAGDAFGWSSLVGRDRYSATAECLIPTALMKLDRNALWDLLESDTYSGMIFFRNLSRILGNRLLKSYQIITDAVVEQPA